MGTGDTWVAQQIEAQENRDNIRAAENRFREGAARDRQREAYFNYPWLSGGNWPTAAGEYKGNTLMEAYYAGPWEPWEVVSVADMFRLCQGLKRSWGCDKPDRG